VILQPSDQVKEGDFMFWFILACLCLIVALVFSVVGSVKKVKMIVMGVALSLAAVFFLFSVIYFQDPGESILLRNFTRTISGVTQESGMHFKSPFDTCIRYDVRNNTITSVGDGTEDEVKGGNAIGPRVTFQDLEGVTGGMDVVVRYSLDSGAVEQLYKDYLDQKNFVIKVVAQDVRSVTRQVAGRYGTLKLFNSRAEVELAIFDALAKRWSNMPIIVEGVNVQEIRYSEEITQRYDDAQAARVAIDKAQAEKEAAEITAETARIIAQGQADANAILNESLSDQVLQQRYIDAISKGSTIYVVPEGSTPMIGVPSS
jgi:regulator of protease activity HflC (stomatin/prohibitin superfamily)